MGTDFGVLHWQRAVWAAAAACFALTMGCGDSSVAPAPLPGADAQSSGDGDVQQPEDTGQTTGVDSDTTVPDTQEPPPEDTAVDIAW